MKNKTKYNFFLGGKDIWKVGTKKDLNWAQAKKKYPKLNPFGDADKDGIKNKFDCRPFDKKRGGWTHQHYKDSVVIKVPVKRAYHQRGRYGMYNKLHAVNVMTHGREAHRELAEKRARELSDKGYIITKIGVAKDKEDRDWHGVVKYKRPAKVYKKEIKNVMTPAQYSNVFSGDYEAESPEKYVKNMAKAIKSKKELIELPMAYASYLERGSPRFGEARHRILAAMKAKEKSIPIEIVRDNTYSTDEQIRKLKVQEARDFAEKKPKPEVLKEIDYDYKDSDIQGEEMPELTEEEKELIK